MHYLWIIIIEVVIQCTLKKCTLIGLKWSCNLKIKSDCFISAWSSYAKPKFVNYIGYWLGKETLNNDRFRNLDYSLIQLYTYRVNLPQANSRCKQSDQMLEKSGSIFHKNIAQIVVTADFAVKWCFSKSLQIHQNWITFVTKFVSKPFKNSPIWSHLLQTLHWFPYTRYT